MASYRAFNVTAVVITLFVLLLPAPSRDVYAEFEGAPKETLERVAALQAATVANPDDLPAVVALTEELVSLGSLEAALRTVLGPAASSQRGRGAWQVQLAAADAWVQDLEFKQALPYAEAAVAACKTDGSCGADWNVRLGLYRTLIARLVESGIDARKEPDKLRRLMAEIAPTIHLSNPDKTERHKPPPSPSPAPQE